MGNNPQRINPQISQITQILLKTLEALSRGPLEAKEFGSLCWRLKAE
jgi:hypothetical protein